MPLDRQQMEDVIRRVIPDGQTEVQQGDSRNYPAQTQFFMNTYLRHMNMDAMVGALGDFIYHYECQEAPGKSAADTLRHGDGMRAAREQLTGAIKKGLQAAETAGVELNADSTHYAGTIIRNAQDQLRQLVRPGGGG